jgi:hypothetical protein
VKLGAVKGDDELELVLDRENALGIYGSGS